MGNAADREAEELKVLYEISQALASGEDLEAALKDVLRKLRSAFGMTRGMIALHDPDSDQLNIEIAHKLSADQIKKGRYKIGEGIMGAVFQSGRPAAIPSVGSDPHFLDRTGARKNLDLSNISFICAPIKTRNKVLGVLSVDKPYESEKSLEEDVRLLTIVTSMISQAVRLFQKHLESARALQMENASLRDELKGRYGLPNMIGNSHRMREVYDLVRQVSGSNATVLIRGETGAGKELVASAIHYAGSREKKPFIRVNCPAFPETLIESELFGHAKGAFTGALRDKKGRFELADGGTIFLDEIGELSLAVQSKLLRVIQEKEFEPLGSEKTFKADVRIIAATNKNLEEAVEKGDFRQDLYYRLNGFVVFLPPLRDRKGDLPALIDFFIDKYAKENGKSVRRISTQGIDMLMKYHWPGNVRELQNVIERAVILCDGAALQSHHFPPTLQTIESSQSAENGAAPTLSQSVERLEKSLIEDALTATSGNRAAAARLLGITERMIGYKISKLGIDSKNPTKM